MKTINCSGNCTNSVEVEDDFEFMGCCSGIECGCRGRETNPVFCDDCEKAFTKNTVQAQSGSEK